MKELTRTPNRRDFVRNWSDFVAKQKLQPYFKELKSFLDNEYRKYKIYPPLPKIFRALELTPFEAVKVVIVGTEPYHQHRQADGLAFSVNSGTEPPSLLRNIYAELSADICCPRPRHGNLSSWAKQGVLLLNTVLTVKESSPNSHRRRGWEQFTAAIIQYLRERALPPVFLLWGREAQKLLPLSGTCNSLVSSHPQSPYNGFFGCRHFTKSNEMLKLRGMTPIDWRIR